MKKDINIKDILKKDIDGFHKNWKPFKESGIEAFNEFKNKGTRKKQIPNMLTASRLLAPFFIIPTALSGNIVLTFIFTCLFACTDGLDGFLARKFHSTSEFGRELDPLTDKLFALSLLIPLLFFNPLLIITLGMEGIIGGINFHSRLNDNFPRTNITGKIKTAALSLTILFGYLSMLLNVPASSINSLIYATLGLQGIAATKYYLAYKKDEKEKESINNKDNVDNNDNKENIIIKENTKEKVNSIKEQKEMLLSMKEELTNKEQNIEEKPKVYKK